MNDLDIGLVLATPTNLLDFRAFLAGEATMESIGLVGVPGITAEATDMQVAVNLSVGLVTDFEVIDFVQSFPDQDFDGDDVIDGDGFAVPAGADNVILDFENLLIKTFGSVRIGVETGGSSWFGMSGDLDFELTDSHLRLRQRFRLRWRNRHHSSGCHRRVFWSSTAMAWASSWMRISTLGSARNSALSCGPTLS